MIGQDHAHLQGGATQVARCLALRRADGMQLGFTDHDRDLVFDGITFRADAGITARMLAQATGLSVDTSEVMGALSDAAITEVDIRAGRWDGAEVRIWLVDWALPARRLLRFVGRLGEITRKAGAFTAELRGLSDALNRADGRLFQALCPAVLGDGDCRVDLAAAGFATEAVVVSGEADRRFLLAPERDHPEGWYAAGWCSVLTGAAAGLGATVHGDARQAADARRIELWQSLGAPVVAGDRVRLQAGCDKRWQTCRQKFDNLLNFRGFPHLPGDDWLVAAPERATRRDGGKLVS